MIKIKKPLCFSEIGKKDNQEDYLYPADANTETKVFILCDGMGGHDNGEVASKTAADALGDFLTSCNNVDIPTFEAGLATAYDALDKIESNSSKKPGTTMTCLCLNDDNYLVAHIGDSRIYHVRPSLFSAETKRGGILYQSSDHSLVNDLLKAGELTEEEARDFPQKNIITRAMQPNLPKRYKADIYTFDDIQSGDYFFLCCDGILEQLSNEMLCEILADKKLDDSQKLAKIKSICDGNTRDNYTCWLIPIDRVKINNDSNVSEVIQAECENTTEELESVSSIRDNVNEEGNAPQTAKHQICSRIRQYISKRSIAFFVGLILLIIIGAICAFLLYCKHISKENLPNAAEINSLRNENGSIIFNYNNSEVSIRVDNVTELPDTIDASSVFAANMMGCDSNGNTLIRFETNDGIPIKAWKETYFYPTLWATEKMECIQFIYLFDCGYRQVEELQISEDGILYPDSHSIVDATIHDLNKATSKESLLISIKNVQQYYTCKNVPLSYELENWDKELIAWQRLVSGYTAGMLENDDTRRFCIDPYEVILKITFRLNNGKEVTKCFAAHYSIGN